MQREKLKYIRFITKEINSQSGRPAGIFCAAYDLAEMPNLVEYHRLELRRILVWFSSHLEKPNRFYKSNSKGAIRRNWNGLSWYKDSANNHITMTHELAFILREYGVITTMISTDRPGYIVYEDDNQIVAEPFSDTPISG